MASATRQLLNRVLGAPSITHRDRLRIPLILISHSGRSRSPESMIAIHRNA
jgi:hypothetical protein